MVNKLVSWGAICIHTNPSLVPLTLEDLDSLEQTHVHQHSCVHGGGLTGVAGHRLHCNLSSSALRGGLTTVIAQKHRNINATGHLLNMLGGFNCSLSFNCAYNYITAVLIKWICICIPSQDKPFFRDNPWWLSWRPPVLFHVYWAMLPSLNDMGIWNKYSNNG